MAGGIRFAVSMPDGTTLIIMGSEKRHIERDLRKKITDEQYKGFIKEISVPPNAVEIIELPDDWPPADLESSFLDALVIKGGILVVDMAKARECWRKKLRLARSPIFSRLDAEYMKADEDGDAGKKKEIAALKRKLRDITADPAIEAAKTPEELTKFWPAILK